MDHLVDKQLAVCWHTKCCSQRLHVQLQISDEQCSSGVGIGTPLLGTGTVGLSAHTLASLPDTTCMAQSMLWERTLERFTGHCNPHEIQQVQGPASGSGQSQVQIEARMEIDQQQLCQKGVVDIGGCVVST